MDDLGKQIRAAREAMRELGQRLEAVKVEVYGPDGKTLIGYTAPFESDVIVNGARVVRWYSWQPEGFDVQPGGVHQDQAQAEGVLRQVAESKRLRKHLLL